MYTIPIPPKPNPETNNPQNIDIKNFQQLV